MSFGFLGKRKMKMFKTIALLSALLITPTFAADTCRGVPMPPLDKRVEPNVPYTIKWVPHSEVSARCAVAKYAHPHACAFPDPTKKSPTAWTILISDNMSRTDRACVVIYEKAHLPPNLWENLFLFSTEERKAWLKYVDEYRAWEKANIK